jgi:hypothetical protein
MTQPSWYPRTAEFCGGRDDGKVIRIPDDFCSPIEIPVMNQIMPWIEETESDIILDTLPYHTERWEFRGKTQNGHIRLVRVE